MKNLTKFWIITFVVVIGFSYVGCKEDTGENTIDDSLIGVWVGDSANGTLTVTKDGFAGAPAESKASSVAFIVSTMMANAAVKDDDSYTTNDGKIQAKISGQTIVYYNYKIDGSTLTIWNGDAKDDEVFKGTK